MKQYWKNYVWEYLACVAASASLLLNIAQGFYIPDSMADSIPLALAVCAVLTAVFYLGGYNKITMALIPAAVAAAAALWFLALRARGVDIVDAEGSDTAHYIYWLAVIVICVAVYLCSRFRIGTAVLFLAGCSVSAVLKFFEFEVFTWAGLLFAGSCIALFLLRQFRAQAMGSSTASPDFFRWFRAAVVLLLAGAALCCGVYYAVIRPLSPPTVELDFLERYLAFSILEHTGISDYFEIENEELYTNETDDTVDDTGETEEGDTPLPAMPDTPESSDSDTEQQPPSGQTQLSAVSYTITPLTKVMFSALLILLVFALPPAVRIFLRRRKMNRLAVLPPSKQICGLYRFYLKRFKRLGWEMRVNETPLEYLGRCSEPLSRYLENTCGLEELTYIFIQARYGGAAPTDEQCAQCREIYGVFLKNCRRQLGAARYMMKFFVL